MADLNLGFISESFDPNLAATVISFDNFEKENASEKKRKKIYMSQTEIQKLINQKKDDIQNEAEVDEDSENEITDESELS